VRVAGQFESAVRRCDKPVVAGAAVFVVEIGEIGRAVEWQDRLLKDGTRWEVYKRFFTGAGLLEELGGEVLFEGRWFVLVRA